MGVGEVHRPGQLLGGKVPREGAHPEALARQVYRVRAVQNRHPQPLHVPGGGEELRLYSLSHGRCDAGVDALITADLGTFTLAGKYALRCERHVSTQVSVANHVSARAWYELGAKRVILAREVSLEEIREIRARTPAELELEAFVHGAMCVSYSGRCLLSNYMTGRDSNRGACAQPCRYQYYLMEEKRPGEYFPVFEDGKGTYIMNSRDMCMIDHVDDLIDAGLSSLKIEGRAKSAYYAAIVTGAYRHVIDDVFAGRPVDPVWRDEVEKVSHRPGQPDPQGHLRCLGLGHGDAVPIFNPLHHEGKRLHVGAHNLQRIGPGAARPRTPRVLLPRGKSTQKRA